MSDVICDVIENAKRDIKQNNGENEIRKKVGCKYNIVVDLTTYARLKDEKRFLNTPFHPQT